MGIGELMMAGCATPFGGGKTSAVDTSLPLLMLNPRNAVVDVDTTDCVHIVVAYTETAKSAVEVKVGAGAQVAVTQVALAGVFAEMRISQAERSRCRIVATELSGANMAFRIDLEGRGAESELAAVFLADGSQHCTIDLATRHLVADCKSDAVVKGVSHGRSTGEFRGLVYVAPDAQHTDAQQQSRNIELGGGHIVTMPQLEIYADDVRCTHGATVGQLDGEALFYMRQRGLSETDARRLQIEGFVNDIVSRCEVAEVRDAISAEIAVRLTKI